MGKLSSTGFSESLSLHANSISITEENEEDTDAQEFSSEEEYANVAITKQQSPGKKINRRSSAPAALSTKKTSGKGKGQPSPFDAGRLSSIGVGGARTLAPTNKSVLNDMSQLSDDNADFGDMGGGEDGHDIEDEFDWRATPGSSVKGSHQKSVSSVKSTSTKNLVKVSKTPRTAPKQKEDGEDDEEKEVPKTEIKSKEKKKKTKRRVSYAPEESTISTPGTSEFPRGRALPDESYREEDTGVCNHTTLINMRSANQSFWLYLGCYR